MNRILPIFLPIVAVLCAFFCSCTSEGKHNDSIYTFISVPLKWDTNEKN